MLCQMTGLPRSSLLGWRLRLPSPRRKAQGGPGSVASSYTIATDGSLQAICASVPDFQATTCWIGIGKNSHFAYTTNNGSNTTTGYRIGDGGSLSLQNANGITAVSNTASVNLAMLWINKSSGSLIALGEIGGLPASNSAGGIAAH